MEIPARIVLASANPKKVAELQGIIRSAGMEAEILPRPVEVPEVVEDAPDFLGNARLKALALCDATGEAALADDSGLVVEALGGEPGVHSARYAGDHASDEQNVDRLLEELGATGSVTAEQRRAHFHCVIVLRGPDGSELVSEGTVHGSIAMGRSGSGGFGYDPVFIPQEGDGRTFAEMTASEKAVVSHRGHALRSMQERLTARE